MHHLTGVRDESQCLSDKFFVFIIIWLCECQLEEGGDVGTDECTCVLYVVYSELGTSLL
jgi:hypothetical protein